MKRIVLALAFVAVAASYALPAFADGCYMCDGGTFVKYTGGDDQSKRKAAEACGCKITGTRGSCDAANLKVLCTVKNERDEEFLLACQEKSEHEEERSSSKN